MSAKSSAAITADSKEKVRQHRELNKSRWRLVRGANIQPSLRLTLYALHWSQGANKTAFCKRETLADEVGVSVDQLTRKMQSLEKLKVLKRVWTQRNGKTLREYSIDFARLAELQRSPIAHREADEPESPALTDSSGYSLTNSSDRATGTLTDLSDSPRRFHQGHSDESVRHADTEIIHGKSNFPVPAEQVCEKETCASLEDVISELNITFEKHYLVTEKRKQAFAARMKDPIFRDNWKAAIRKARESPFCCGHNDRGWMANPDWFLRPDTVVNLIEGSKYGESPDTPEQRRESANAAAIAAGVRFGQMDFGSGSSVADTHEKNIQSHGSGSQRLVYDPESV